MYTYKIDYYLDQLYEALVEVMEEKGHKPSDVREILSDYDLADGWEDWFIQGDEEWT